MLVNAVLTMLQSKRTALKRHDAVFLSQRSLSTHVYRLEYVTL